MMAVPALRVARALLLTLLSARAALASSYVPTSCTAWGKRVIKPLLVDTGPAQSTRLAVCLTGQLRFFPLGFASVVPHVLVPLSRVLRADFFYVGPRDESFHFMGAWLKSIPRLRSVTLYNQSIHFIEGSERDALLKRKAPIAWLNGSNQIQEPQRVAMPLPQLHLAAHQKCRRACLLQAFQARQCLRLIKDREAKVKARSNSSWRYTAVLRQRADLAIPLPLRLPLTTSSLGFTGLTTCPLPHESLVGHDFALLGSRSLMGIVLGSLDRIHERNMKSAGCRGLLGTCSGADAGGSLEFLRSHKHHARCESAVGARRGGPPVCTVRGSAASGCFFLEEEYPLRPKHTQFRIREMRSSAIVDVAKCLNLSEAREARQREQHGAGGRTGLGCTAAGGRDGDFRTDSSPFSGVSYH